MFSCVSNSLALALIAFPILAAAKPWTTTTTTTPPTTTVTVTSTVTATEPASQCNTGSVQCCDTVEPATDPDATALLGVLGIVLTDVDVLVGISCTPITIGGVGSGGSCSQQAVCCENNNFNGVINIACDPVNISL